MAAWPVLRRLVTPNLFATSDVELWGATWGWVGALALLASLTARHDAWMGAMVGWLALTPLVFVQWRAEILLVAIVALGITECRHATAAQRERAARILGALGIVTAGYVVLQRLGWDLLTDGFHRSYAGTPGGPLAHEGTTGAFLSLTALVAPTWMLLVIAPAVVLTQARGAVIALLVGLVVRYWPLPWPLVALTLVVALGTAAALARTPDPWQSVKFRAVVQGQAVAHMLRVAPITGLGFLRWHESKHVVNPPQHLNGRGATLNPLHNDLAQWIVETGIPGAALALAALVALTRRIARGDCWPQATPALAGAFILTLTWYPLHMVPTGAAIATLLGLSTPLPTQGA